DAWRVGGLGAGRRGELSRRFSRRDKVTQVRAGLRSFHRRDAGAAHRGRSRCGVRPAKRNLTNVRILDRGDVPLEDFEVDDVAPGSRQRNRLLVGAFSEDAAYPGTAGLYTQHPSTE